VCAGRKVVVDDDPVLGPVVDGLDLVDDSWTADVGVTTAVVAAAKTSTLALAFDAAHPRRTSLVPPVHVAVVPVDRLVPTYADAVRALAAVTPAPSGMRMVTGPSGSGDIEQTHIRGMHGPVQVHVVVVGTEADSAAEAAPAAQEKEPVAEPVSRAAPEAAPGAAGRTPAAP
jgi:L-lactate utilization protein LutB